MGTGVYRRSTAGDPDRPVVRDSRGQHRCTRSRSGRRGADFPDVPQPGVGPDRVGVPVPVAGRWRGAELRADGGRPRAAGPVAEQGRGPADLRGDRPHQTRSRPCWNTWAGGSTAPASSRFRRCRPQGDDAVHAALQARSRRHRVLLPAEHAEVHGQADPATGREHLDREQGRDQVGLLPQR